MADLSLSALALFHARFVELEEKTKDLAERVPPGRRYEGLRDMLEQIRSAISDADWTVDALASDLR